MGKDKEEGFSNNKYEDTIFFILERNEHPRPNVAVELFASPFAALLFASFLCRQRKE